MTVGALRVAASESRQFGVMQTEADGRIVGFRKSRPVPKTIPGDEQHILASMGIYVFTARFMFEQLCLDATRTAARTILARISCRRSRRIAYLRFRSGRESQAGRLLARRGHAGRLLRSQHGPGVGGPDLNMYDQRWPIRTYLPNLPPPKFVFAEEGAQARRGQALDTIVCLGSIVSGGQVQRSILGAKCRVNSFARVEDSILFDGVDIGRHAKVRRAIIDKGVHIPPGTSRSATTTTTTGPAASPSAKAGVIVIAKADGIEHFLRGRAVVVVNSLRRPRDQWVRRSFLNIRACALPWRRNLRQRGVVPCK